MESNKNLPQLDCPVDYLIGDATGKVMNEYGRFPCKIGCGVYALIVRGSAKATVNISQLEFHQNDALLIEPGTFLLIHEFSEDALVHYILFSGKFLERHSGQRIPMASMKLLNPIIHLSQEQADVLLDMAKTLNKASNTMPSMLNSERMVHVLNLLNTSFLQHIQKKENPITRPLDRKEEIYMEYCQLVLKHYTEWHHVNQYADAMRITLPHLCSTIKQAGNRTAGDIISDAIITDAKAQLKITTLQIKEIALSLGFANVAFFNRFFRLHVGCTPKVYRQQS